MGEMRALTVKQPWAWAIAAGKKPVENRTWPTGHRGMVAIHAGKMPDRAALADRDRRSPLSRAIAWHTRLWTPPEYVYGAVIAVAEVTDCHDGAAEQGECSEWADRWQWHWVLANVRPLAEPVPCRGMLSLWRLPDDVEKAVREQLEGSHA
jgi:hypothetical protein